MELAHMEPTPANLRNGNVRCSLTLKNKIKISVWNNICYLRISFFLMPIKDPCFKQVHKPRKTISG